MKKKLDCILMIDDDEPTNFLNRMILEEVGCAEHIQIIQDAREALEYLRHATNGNQPCDKYPKPQLIFLDINMPAMDGWEFLTQYTELPKDKTGEMTIVMLTTSFNPEDELRARKIPYVAGFKNKPLTAEDINDILQNHFAAYYE